MRVKTDVVIVGAGPIGLEMAAALKEAGISFLLFDKGQIGQTIFNFPPETRFFSSSERIGIAGIPIHTVDQQKCSREVYLAYLRAVSEYYDLNVNSYEEVIELKKNGHGFLIGTKSPEGKKSYESRFLILATGGLSEPRLLGVPGENLPHVSVKLEDPHQYFQKKVIIIGGKNSAVETALRCFHAGADPTLILRGEKFDAKRIKYWLLPELEGRIKKGQIACHFNCRVKEIVPGKLVVEGQNALSCDFVIKAIGFNADMGLFKLIGATLTSDKNCPLHDPGTMETDVEDAYALGTAVAGTQDSFEVYIENTHQHVGKILSSLCKKLKMDEPPLRWIKKRFRMVAQLEE